MELDLEDLITYADEYEHKYFRMIDEDLPKGLIDFKNNIVWYNPLYNDEGETFCHEMMHHHYIKVYNFDAPKPLVESNGLLLYKMYKPQIDEFVKYLID